MPRWITTLLILSLFVLSTFTSAFAAPTQSTKPKTNVLDELDPFDPNVEQLLEQWDADHLKETGIPALLPSRRMLWGETCVREACTVWAQVVRSTQTMYLFVNGELQNTFKVSSGAPGHETPDFDRHPNGRVYDAYTSTKYPEGDYNGLGNMPYAVFISGGFAIHGTTKGNFKRLGSPASHGCIRLHPDNALIFNRLVRQYGVDDVWITVQE